MNLPNILACCRIVLAPVLFFLLSFEFTGFHQSWVDYFAALAFGIAALTDFFDGYIARAWGQKTKLGAILDPLADKMLMLGAFLGTEPSVQSAAACCAFVGIAGELAAEKTDACGGGTMTFRNLLIDEISLMTTEKMKKCNVHA